jgi:hypothetical protein
LTPDKAREQIIRSIEYAAYREADSGLHDTHKNRLFGSAHYHSGRFIATLSLWPNADFEAKMVTLLA